MGIRGYRFVTHWRVVGTLREVADILTDLVGFPRWWPSVYLEAREIEPGDERGVGRRLRLRTRGRLPYSLEWEMRVTESDYPKGFAIEATGDLVGRGAWTLEQQGAWVEVRYDWRVRPEKPLLKLWTPLWKPVFSADHRWAMARGEEGLRLELARRRAADAAERERLPAPRPPASSGAWLLALGAAAVAAAAAIVLLSLRIGRRGRHKRRFPRC
jgi:hypothetical protein